MLVYFLPFSSLLSFTGGKLAYYFFTLKKEHIVFSRCKVKRLFLHFAKKNQIVSFLCKKNSWFIHDFSVQSEEIVPFCAK